MTAVSAALVHFLEAGRADGLRPATLKWYTSLLTTFAAKHECDQLQDVSVHHIRRYLIDLRERQERYVAAPHEHHASRLCEAVQCSA